MSVRYLVHVYTFEGFELRRRRFKVEQPARDYAHKQRMRGFVATVQVQGKAA